MFPLPRNPSLFQVNTRIFLQELSVSLKKKASLDDISDSWLDSLQGRFDIVWFLGVWQTGAEGRSISQSDSEWTKTYQTQLPDFTPADVSGSPFAITHYSLHSDFGDSKSLIRLRTRLHSRRIRLLLDFVPNHVAPDHPWVTEHPEFFVGGSEELLIQEPLNYTRKNGKVLARGRDPFFPGWKDTLQLNYRHQGLRKAMQLILFSLAELCDGIRCDMAMLILPDIFNKTWGDLSLPTDRSPPVDESFWRETIEMIKASFPHFLFMAEVYWDREWDLQMEGFDYTYDKRLYDRLKHQNVNEVKGINLISFSWEGHLHADLPFQLKLVRFLENHDEPRAAKEFSREVHKAAAVITFLTPGLRFFHEGQLEGRQVHISMHLGRRPKESVDTDLQHFYGRLLGKVLPRKEVKEGTWRLLDSKPAWEGNWTSSNFVAFSWSLSKGHKEWILVVVNFSSSQGQSYISLEPWHWAEGKGRNWKLTDQMADHEYIRETEELQRKGLYVDLLPWQAHVFVVSLL